jgi:transglutaminase-like putative cysteine protease
MQSLLKYRSPLTLAAALAIAAGGLTLSSCERPVERPSGRKLVTGSNDRAVYLRSVSATLNDLAGNVDLELQPAQPILTASSSADGNEVRATCTANPNTQDGIINYLLVADANANFRSIDVRPGDVVRYYVNLDQESAERGIEQRTALELRVRRLDARDPENALIIDTGLNAPVVIPQRIEIWRYSDKRMDAIRSALNRYVQLRRPPVGWEPAPDVGALQQVVERANQWVRNQPRASSDWQVEPLLARLPDELRGAKGVAEAIAPVNLRDGLFADWEGRQLAEAVWMRDVAQWARGSATSDADVAAVLFDWVVRNIDLDPADAPRVVFHPWQALVYGHGSAADRAWVFIELCRQQRIDAVVVRPKLDDASAAAPQLVGVLVGDQIQLYDPQLGLPLAGQGDQRATLAELAENDALLRQLDVEGQFTYPLTAEQLGKLEAFIAASPLQLARRSKLLEDALEGEEFVRLTTTPAALSERLARHPQFVQVSLWTVPFERIAAENSIDQESRLNAAAEFAPLAERPLLWKARVLHFQGNKDVRAEQRNDPLAESRQGHMDALKLYQDRSVRPSNAELSKLEPAKRTVYAASKAAASYWLGLLSYDLGNLEVALSWLGDRTLEADPDGRWANGARYNLARTHEAMGHLEDAARLLGSDPADAPQRHGNLVRARRLTAAAAEKPAEQPADAPAAEGQPEAG